MVEMIRECHRNHVIKTVERESRGCKFDSKDLARKVEESLMNRDDDGTINSEDYGYANSMISALPIHLRFTAFAQLKLKGEDAQVMGFKHLDYNQFVVPNEEGNPIVPDAILASAKEELEKGVSKISLDYGRYYLTLENGEVKVNKRTRKVSKQE